MRNYIILILVLSTAMLKASDFILEEKIEFKNYVYKDVIQNDELFILENTLNNGHKYIIVDKKGTIVDSIALQEEINYLNKDFGLTENNEKLISLILGLPYSYNNKLDTFYTFKSKEQFNLNTNFDIHNESKCVYYLIGTEKDSLVSFNFKKNKTEFINIFPIKKDMFDGLLKHSNMLKLAVKYSSIHKKLIFFYHNPNINSKDSSYIIVCNTDNTMHYKRSFTTDLFSESFVFSNIYNYSDINKFLFYIYQSPRDDKKHILESYPEYETFVYDIEKNELSDSILSYTSTVLKMLPNGNIINLYFDSYAISYFETSFRLFDFKNSKIYSKITYNSNEISDAECIHTFKDYETMFYTAGTRTETVNNNKAVVAVITRYRFKPLSIENVKDELVKIYNSNIISQVDVNKIYVSDYTGNSVEFSSVEDANNYISINSGIQLIKVICGNKHYNFKIAK